MTQTRETDLIAQLASADHDAATSAFTTLYRAHWPPLRKSAAGYGQAFEVSRAECEEVAHDAIALLWFDRATPPTIPVTALLRSICRRRILNLCRRIKADDRFLPEHYAQCNYTLMYDAEGNVIWSAPPADAHLLTIELYETIARTINSMSPQRRAVLLDAYCDELSVAESAARHGISQPTVKKLRQRGRHMLMQALSDAGYAPDD